MRATNFLKINPSKLILLVIISIGIFFRFYNLNWGAPFYFHPDERNIASSVSQLSLISHMDPHFFAYGTFPIYVIYLLGIAANFVNNIFSNNSSNIFQVSFVDAIIIGRIISALFSTFIIFLTFKTGKIIGGLKSGAIGALLASFSVGFIQYAHFATFEMWLTLFTLILLYITLKYILTRKLIFFLLASVTLGLLISIKISSLILIPFFILTFIPVDIFEINKSKTVSFLNIEKIVLKIFVLLAISLAIFFITSPFYWLDYHGFISSMKYETSVALGTLPIFYTQGFKNTVPILYQLLKVYPFIINPLIILTFIITLPFLFVRVFKSKNVLILTTIFLFGILFFSQAFIFVKWVRYYIPTLPFIYLILGFVFSELLNTHKNSQKTKAKRVLLTLLIVSLIFSVSYFVTVLKSPDTRMSAASWAEKNISKNSSILSEVYDLGIVPFNQGFKDITLFNFYDLDENPSKNEELKKLVKKADYIILPSQRIFKDRLDNPKLYPEGNNFYVNLFKGELGFKKVYQTPCDIFCKILYLGDTTRFEDTSNVFDRPEVYIFKHEN